MIERQDSPARRIPWHLPIPRRFTHQRLHVWREEAHSICPRAKAAAHHALESGQRSCDSRVDSCLEGEVVIEEAVSPGQSM